MKTKFYSILALLPFLFSINLKAADTEENKEPAKDDDMEEVKEENRLNFPEIVINADVSSDKNER